MAQSYYSPLSINAAQVPTTQTNFPVLVSVIDARFRDGAHGGHVANSNGYDIRPYTDSTLGTAITGYELERYNPIAGEVIMWVKVASLSSSTTPIYLGYGDTSLVTDGSSTTTWSNSFSSVYHFKNGTVLSLVDAMGLNNLSFSPTHAVASSGQIDGCASLSSVLAEGFQGWQFNPTAATYSIWVNGTTFPGAYNDPIIQINAGGTLFNLISVKSTGKMRWAINATTLLQADGTGTATLSTGTWYYLVLSYDSTAGLIGYVNAAVDKTIAANGAMAAILGPCDVGFTNTFGTQWWNGLLDECRFASVARSADWITTEYNNQSSPGTFETLGAEVNLSPMVGLFGIRTVFTRALTIDHLQVPSTQTDFPVLVSFTDTTFKTVANGGHVAANNAFTFSSDSGGSSLLKWEVERYNPSTGEIIAWVKISSVSSVSDTLFYLRYGSTITTDQSDPANVWTNSFLGVYHLADGTTLNANSSTGSNNGTATNTPTATAGQIDGAMAVASASSQYVALPASINPITYTAWINGTSFPAAVNTILAKNGTGAQGVYTFTVNSSAQLRANTNTGAASSTTVLSTATWYYVATTASGTEVLLYLNGALDTTGTGGIPLNGTNTSQIGSDQAGGGRYFNGKMDEARIASVVRSADWITTEYNNQKSASTFIALGVEA